VLGGGRVDLVHVHCGEDLAVLPLAWVAARRHGCPLVATVHLSVRHALRPVTARAALLRAAGGAVERKLLPAADAVIALSASTARLLAGDGPDRPALQRHAQQFGGRVHFTGFVPHAAVPAVLAHVELLMLPSLYEDLSSALIEAMAARLPVVATRVGGIADLVRYGVNGLLVAPRDPPRSPPRSAGSSPAPRRPPGCRRPRGAPRPPTPGPILPARC